MAGPYDEILNSSEFDDAGGKFDYNDVGKIDQKLIDGLDLVKKKDDA